MAMIKTCSTPPIAFPEVSGPVCSFKALQELPLKKCVVAINAWQEGSGDPSPENVRTIHGFSEVNATVGSGNLFDGTFDDYKELSLKAGKQLILQGDMSNDVYLVLRVYDENKIRLQAATTIIGTGTRYGVMTLNSDISYYSIERSSRSGTYNNIMLSFGTTVKPYTPYVTPTIYTIQLGQEVYGAEVDVVNGVAHCTWKKTIVDENSRLEMGSTAYIKSDACDAFYVDTDIDVPRMITLYNKTTCNYLKRVTRNTPVWKDVGYPNCYTINSQQLHFNIANDVLGITDYTQETIATVKEKIKNYLSNNNLEYLVPITPFDIQLTPTQIETLIGNNTIFADTGNTTVQYIKIGG